MTTKTTPKDVFLYLLAIVTLIISVVSFLMLTFQYINVLIPDVLNQYILGIESQARSATAALVVAWPVYILMMYLINKDIKQSAEHLKIGIRKWLIYLTLFVAAITIIVDLITLLNNFLNGDLTMHFFLKTLMVLLVAAGVFGYYIWEIKRQDNKKHPLPRTTAWTLSALIVAVVIAGFFIVGTPAEQRTRRLDEQRISDLQNIQYQLQDYYNRNQALPESSSQLAALTGSLPQDPETKSVYIYHKLSDSQFELCATFAAESDPETEKLYYPEARPINGEALVKEQNWQHGAGEKCFVRTIVTN